MLLAVVAAITMAGLVWLWPTERVLPEGSVLTAEGIPVEVFALEHDGRDEGILELDFREAGECEVGFFGLATRLVGTGAGRWLMNRAITRAWSRDITRFWLHTCSMDSPDALPFYLRSGFVPYQRRVEVFPDPRLTGVLPRDAAPQIPRIDP